MKITQVMLKCKLLEILQENAPARQSGGPRGKPGTNMYSMYPGYMKNNGIYQENSGVVLDYDKIGYIGYANKFSKKPRFIENSIEEFVQWCISLGGRKV